MTSEVAAWNLYAVDQMNKAALQRRHDGFDASSYPEFSENVVDVNLHRTLGHVKRRSDFLV